MDDFKSHSRVACLKPRSFHTEALSGMEKEAGGKWKADTIKKNFRVWTGEEIPHSKQPPSPEEHFRKKYNAFLKEVMKAQKNEWKEVPYALACELTGTGCAYCKDGLCQRMNQLMEEGYSQRKAAEIPVFLSRVVRIVPVDRFDPFFSLIPDLILLF